MPPKLLHILYQDGKARWYVCPPRPVVGTDELLEWDAIVRSVASSGYEKAKVLLQVQSPPYSKIRDMKQSFFDG